MKKFKNAIVDVIAKHEPENIQVTYNLANSEEKEFSYKNVKEFTEETGIQPKRLMSILNNVKVVSLDEAVIIAEMLSKKYGMEIKATELIKEVKED
jgi:hypothetical protein